MFWNLEEGWYNEDKKARGESRALQIVCQLLHLRGLVSRWKTAAKKHKCLQLVSIEIMAGILLLVQKRAWEKGRDLDIDSSLMPSSFCSRVWVVYRGVGLFPVLFCTEYHIPSPSQMMRQNPLSSGFSIQSGGHMCGAESTEDSPGDIMIRGKSVKPMYRVGATARYR